MHADLLETLFKLHRCFDLGSAPRDLQPYLNRQGKEQGEGGYNYAISLDPDHALHCFKDSLSSDKRCDGIICSIER